MQCIINNGKSNKVKNRSAIIMKAIPNFRNTAQNKNANLYNLSNFFRCLP